MNLKFGRNIPIAPPPSLHIGNYLLRTSLPPPAHKDYSKPAYAGLHQILGNGQWGDCCYAGAMHIEDIFRADSASFLPFATQAQTLALYKDIVPSFNPNDPDTDVGGDLPTVLNYWKAKGLFGNGSAKCAGSATVNAREQLECKLSIWTMGNLYMGVALPNHWVNPPPQASGFVWDVAGPPNPQQGHCVIAYGYNARGVLIDSWGLFGTVTWAALAKYFVPAAGGESHTVFSHDWVNKLTQKATNGFATEQLASDLKAISHY